MPEDYPDFWGRQKYIELIETINLINAIGTIDLLANIQTIDLLKKITLIDDITTIGTIEMLERVGAVSSVDKIQEIVNIAKISSFGERGTWLPFSKSVSSVILFPTSGYRIKVLGAFYWCKEDVVTEIRFMDSGNVVLGLPTLGAIGMNPTILKKPIGAKDEPLYLYMSLNALTKGWVVYEEILGTGTTHTKTITELLGLLDTKEYEYTPYVGSWLTPDSVDDPDSGWAYDDYSIDDDTYSYAESAYIPTGQWTKYLVFTHTEITSSKMKYWCSSRTGKFLIDIDVYKDGEWVDVYYGATADYQWIEKTFASGQVTKIRIRFYGETSGGYAAHLHEVKFYG